MTPNQVRTRQTATCRVAALVDSPAGAGCRELRTGPGRVRIYRALTDLVEVGVKGRAGQGKADRHRVMLV